MTIVFRASSVGHPCIRKLWYPTMGHIPEPLSRETLRIFAVGTALEAVVLGWLQEDGWTVEHNEGSQEAAQQPGEGLQLQDIGSHRHRRQHQKPLEKLHGPGVHHQQQQAIDDEGDDEDVQEVLPSQVRDGHGRSRPQRTCRST